MRTMVEQIGMQRLCSELKKIRLSRNLTQAKLAEMIGMQQAHISMIERGLRAPTLDTLMLLCVALNAELQIVARKRKEK